MFPNSIELQEDLQQVKTQFRAEISQKDGYIAKASGNDSFVHSSLVLLAAKLGKYDFSRLRPAAVAVELLDLALREHYQKSDGSPAAEKSNPGSPARQNLLPDRRDQLSLIRGDHLFARALNLVAALGDCRVVSLLSQVIADVSEFQLLEVHSRHATGLTNQFHKMVSLYVASAHVGAIMGELGLATTNTLGDFGLNLGLHCEAGSCSRENFKVTAKEILQRLPETQYRSLLENLLGTRDCQKRGFKK